MDLRLSGRFLTIPFALDLPFPFLVVAVNARIQRLSRRPRHCIQAFAATTMPTSSLVLSQFEGDPLCAPWPTGEDNGRGLIRNRASLRIDNG